MLESFKGKGHCLTMDSAYAGDVMMLIGHFEWDINMVGTVQSSKTGAGPEGKHDTQQELNVGTYEHMLYQHAEHPLTYAIWADNTFVKVLSNFHSPAVVKEGLLWKRRVNRQR